MANEMLSESDAQRWFYGGTPPTTALESAYPFCSELVSQDVVPFVVRVKDSSQSFMPLQAQCGHDEQGEAMG